MPGSYRIDVAKGIVYSRAWGPLTDEEIAAHAKTLRADPRFDPGFRQIVDYRELTTIGVTSDGVHEVARQNPFRRDARRAFVVTTEEAFGLVRMFWEYTDSSREHFAIFRAIEPAFQWVGLDPATPWPTEPPDAIFDVR